jgi:hypothetical protein
MAPQAECLRRHFFSQQSDRKIAQDGDPKSSPYQ